jgi:hypothetical protein
MATKKPICSYSGVDKELQSGDSVYDVKQKSLTVESPTAAENIAFFYTDVAITITRINDVLKGTGTPSLTWNIHFDSTRDDGTPTALFTSNRTTTSTSGATTTTINNPTIPAGSYVWFITSSSTTVTEFHVTLTFTQS